MSEKMSHGDEVSKLIKNAHNDITRKKGKDYAPNVHEIQKWIDSYLESKNINEIEDLKGGLADNKTLIKIAKKHTTIGNRNVNEMVKLLKKQLSMGMKVEMEHTNNRKRAEEIAMDHLSENPNYYTKLKKIETKEQTTASSSGSFEGSVFGGTNDSMVKRKINTIHNSNLDENEEEIKEVVDASSSGSYDVPFLGKTPKGRKNPLKIDGPDSIYKSRAVKDKNWPRYGGPGSVYVKVKEKCKKFPYCNQGDTGALQFIKEDDEIQQAIIDTSKKYGIPKTEIEKLVLNEIREIFI
jgi:hypothetical protein